ncbi:MAG: hypothetical protein M3Q23_17005 [Actinomycetota bacterium]|nr:hypothetical protein [Actinomycetota bacterium]
MREGTLKSDARPAFYALRSGGWRDYWTLLHPPYTAWHLSYVAIGAAVAPRFDGGRLGASVLAFFLGVGITAHALDELSGRPLATRIPDRVLWAMALIALAGAVGLGVLGAAKVSWWLLAFVAFGAFIVLAYNLELFRGRFHGDLWFALAWGAFPALTGAFAQAGTLRPAGIVVAAGCAGLSAAQRTLSTPVRRLRRRAVRVEGSVEYADGSVERLDAAVLRAAPELALRILALALSLLAAGLVAARLA